MEFNDKKIQDLAVRIYELDEEVYKELGSSLGRVFTGDRDVAIRNIMEVLHERNQGFKIRSELALISNMARTINNKDTRHEIMKKYGEILDETMNLPTSYADGDILDPKIADLNSVNLHDRFKEDDHIIICIGRSCGCGGNEIGFELADALRMNFYDVSVMNEVFKQQSGDDAAQAIASIQQKKHESLIKRIKNFAKYHGLPQDDVLFFDTSKFLVEKAKQEDFVVMGRFADAILTNNHIPHVSIFVTAPVKRRVQRLMEINPKFTAKQAKVLIDAEDKRHQIKYKYYTGRKWSKASNYDLCINSASYGVKGSIDLIIRALRLEDRVKDNSVNK